MKNPQGMQYVFPVRFPVNSNEAQCLAAFALSTLAAGKTYIIQFDLKIRKLASKHGVSVRESTVKTEYGIAKVYPSYIDPIIAVTTSAGFKGNGYRMDKGSI
jgi:hypothetical protein